eukprot:765504-Hanusia_phi.AAC.4
MQGQDVLYPPELLGDEAPSLGNGTCLGHAIAVCEAAVAISSPMIGKHVLSVLARLRFALNKSSSAVDISGAAEASLIMLHELMKVDPDSKSVLVGKVSPPLSPNAPRR